MIYYDTTKMGAAKQAGKSVDEVAANSPPGSPS